MSGFDHVKQQRSTEQGQYGMRKAIHGRVISDAPIDVPPFTPLREMKSEYREMHHGLQNPEYPPYVNPFRASIIQ